MKFPCLILALLFPLLAGCARNQHPSDDALLKNFSAHEPEFDGLLTMLRADKKLERVDVNWTRPDNPASAGVPPERIKVYREIFKKLNIPRGFDAYHDPERFTFLASASGLSIGGSGKGYAYLEERPELVVASLDNYRSPTGRSFTAYRHIKGNWYLFYDYED